MSRAGKYGKARPFFRKRSWRKPNSEIQAYSPNKKGRPWTALFIFRRTLSRADVRVIQLLHIGQREAPLCAVVPTLQIHRRVRNASGRIEGQVQTPHIV